MRLLHEKGSYPEAGWVEADHSSIIEILESLVEHSAVLKTTDNDGVVSYQLFQTFINNQTKKDQPL
jgi:hypothetical protein